MFLNLQQVLVTLLLFAVKGTISILVNSTINTTATTTQILKLGDFDNEEEQGRRLNERSQAKNLKIAFGSCYGMLHFKSDIFKTINQYDPHLWIWLGDAVYLDDVAGAAYKSDNSMPLEYVEERYMQTKSDPHYQELQNKTPIIGVWDDHDYGVNNGDFSFQRKQVYRKLFLDFVKEPRDSLRSRELHRGIYQDYITQFDGLKVHIILLDVRFHYNQDAHNDRLSEMQYMWLEQILLQNRDADLTFIGSGVQVIPERYTSYIEQIGHPTKRRLLNLIRDHRKSGVILLSGDVHYAQFFNTECESYTGYNIFEICSSGLTHYLSQASPYIEHFIEGHTPKLYKESEIFMNINFGSIELSKVYDNQSKRVDTQISLSIRDQEGKEVENRNLLLQRDLKYNPKKVRYSEMCTQTHQNGRKIQMVGRIIQSFMFDKHFEFMGQFFLLFTVMVLVPTAVSSFSRDPEYLNISNDNRNKNEISIAFGSCFQIYDMSTDIFSLIKTYSPDVWIWNGDAAYLDDVSYPGLIRSYLGGNSVMNQEYVKQQFQKTLNQQEYYDFITIEPKPKVIGIWDDHDYGINDGDLTFEAKLENRDQFLNFIGEPEDSQRRLQNNTGLFQDYIIIKENLKIHIILLDLRYNYNKTSGDRFGKDQIEWLNQAIQNDANLTFIVSGIQVMPDRRFYYEQLNWQNKKVLFDLINRYEKSGVIFLSEWKMRLS
eukprot:403368424